MRRTLRTRPIAALVGAVLGALVLAGCGAGQITQTSSQVTAVNGANATVGSIAVRNARFVLGEDVDSAVAYRRGASASLEMVIVNTGNSPDELMSVTSEIGNGEVLGPRVVPAGHSLVVEGLPVAELGDRPTAAAATPSASADRPSAPPPPAAGQLPPDAPAVAGTTHVVLTGLREDIRSGLTYEVVLHFRDAGPVSLPVPVATSDTKRKDEHAA
ncbi:MAG: hypothetical protein L0H84_02245 [Pseudonocardia sp.]|nr:hypothetical protein [Pseudonocardia sp.]